MPSETKWQKFEQAGEQPKARSGHSITKIEGASAGSYVMYGGILDQGNNSKIQPTNEIYKLGIRAGKAQWEKVHIEGDQPMARAQHVAICPPKSGAKSECIFIYGGHASPTRRLNDCWWLETKGECKWVRLAGDKDVEANQDSTIGAPPPRANCGYCYSEGKVFIYGGHGGLGYKRHAFDDIWSFDIETETWKRYDQKGINMPIPMGRGGNTIFVSDGKLFSYGGWNSETQYEKVISYDFATEEWEDNDVMTQKPRWNHNAMIVEAIPSWKYFIFGGESEHFAEGQQRSFGEVVNTVQVLDLKDMKWDTVKPESEENMPTPREYSAMCYHQQFNQLIVFGGWNSGWLGDIYGLNVSKIVGPPYAITKIEPPLGQQSGGETITVYGQGFQDGSTYNVFFTCGNAPVSEPGKMSLQVNGTATSDSTLTCVTPDFTQFEPRFEAVVQLMQPGQDLTTTSQKFTFFMNTRANRSLCYGPGLLHDLSTAEPATIIIQARNDKFENRTSGRDVWDVKIIHEEDGKEIDKEAISIVDKDDGSYHINYKVNRPGKVAIKIYFKDDKGKFVEVRGSPYSATFSASAPASANSLTGQHLNQHLTSEIATLQAFMKDTAAGATIKDKDINDVKVLIGVKDKIDEVKAKNDDVTLQLDQLEETLRMLVSHNIPKDKQLKEYKKLTDDFTGLKKLAKDMEKEIKKNVDHETSNNQKQIQALEDSMKSFSNNLKKRDFYQYKTGRDLAVQKLKEIRVEVAELDKKIEDYGFNSLKFNQPGLIENCKVQVVSIKTEIDSMNALWDKINELETQFNSWLNMSWSVSKPYDMEDDAKKSMKSLKEMKCDKKSNTYLGIMDVLKAWLTFLPLIADLRDDAMRERHWDMVRKKVGVQFEDPNKLIVKDIWNLNLNKYQEDVEEICDQAKQEAKMERTLKKLTEVYAVVKYQFTPMKDSDINQFRLSEEEFEQLENDQMAVQSMTASRYLATFEEQVMGWQMKLGNMNENTVKMQEIQRNWSFLQELFLHSEEVKRELPEQSAQFVHIDAKMREVLRSAFKIQVACDFCNQNDITKTLNKIEADLKVCEKALQDFMENKRTKFPRFYFVAQADLLDLLSNGNNAAKIMKHMAKIFQAIDTLELEEFQQGKYEAKSMISCVGVETVKFTKPLRLMGKVENYLEDVIGTMRSTLKEIGKDSLQRFRKLPKAEWLFQDPAQITLLINMLNWVTTVENAFQNLAAKPKSLSDAYELQKGLLTDLIMMVRKDLTSAERSKVMCMITMDAHSRDIIQKLIEEEVRQQDEFQWQAQLKNYWNESKGDFEFKIADAILAYGYEYLGNGARLVVTPLTDRIYVTATQALHLKMGCAPAGPAGTGKTETTKDLSSNLAKAIYVFNCSDQMDYKGMGGIYKGLAASGSWGCFDEFNRLLPSVLSVCSVQFKAVTDAIKEQRGTFTIEGDTLTLDPTCGVFITMNPGYLGRAELPEGLKALFRPITVVVPDLELICENMLMAEGFIEAKKLATKFTTLYSLCRDLLSKAMHYDWGLRAIKSVLVVAGKFKRAEPELPEMDLLMRALRDFNLPKIVADDLRIFMGLLGDLFPQVDPPRKRDMKFEDVIEQVTAESELHNDPEFIKKVVQLKELLEIRWCVFVMGDAAGCGKSATWKTLARAQTKNGDKTTVEDLDPKVQKTDQLYGIVHPTTREWQDGIMSCKMRDLSNRPDTLPKWIILDGDLDANWIESMNSVMDDNRILTLASNERIKLLPHMRLIFEIRNLKFATPATVSRAGILYISSTTGYQWKCYLTSWIKKMKYSEDRKTELTNLFEKYIPKSLDHIRKSFKYLIPNVDISSVIAICKLLEAMYHKFDQQVKNNEMLFVFCAVWCLGAGFGEKDGIQYRKNFSTWWKDTYKTIKFGNGSVFEYYIDMDNMVMREWKNIESGDVMSKLDTSKRISSFTIPTADTIANSYLMKLFLQVKHSPMLIGLAGCGKTQIIKGMLDDLTTGNNAEYTQQIINFNFYTDSELLQASLESQLEKRGGRAYGPKGKSTLIYFVDDLNMPGPDKYDTQNAIALIRQHKDYEHWYERGKWTLKDIKSTMYVAAMNPFAGSFFINARLQRHFWTACITFPESGSLTTIYTAFMTKHFQKFKPQVFELVQPIIKTTITTSDVIQSTFRKTAINFHYEFNVRHLTNVFQGILQAKQDIITDQDKMVKLWIHEMERIYGDRLVNSQDLQKYRDIVLEQTKRNFNKANVAKHFAAKDPEPLVFASFVESLDEKKYDMFPNLDELTKRLKEALDQYNELNAVMNLVLFEDAMKHTCKISRIIQADAGHALLVGVGGSGKQSLAKLASFICQFTTVSITISATYGITELKTDLQNYYTKSGVKDEGMTWLFTEGQITKEQFMVFINDLLSSGEIADLFDNEGVDTIVNNLNSAVKGEGLVPSKDTNWRFFIDRVRKNLHMALCFSPVGESFRNRAKKFPALVNCTVIDWFHPWPYDALLSVAERNLAELEMAPEVRSAVIKFLPFSFSTVQAMSEEVLVKDRRYIYTTPKSFLELIALFRGMLGKKAGALEQSLDKYENGCARLKNTTEMVGELEIEIREMSVIVEQKKLSAQEQAAIVGAEKEKVDAQNAIAEVESAKANAVAKAVAEKKASVQADLDLAIPLVQKAEAALAGLNVKDFQELKALKTPSAVLVGCMTCVLHLFAGLKDNIKVDKKGRLNEENNWKACLRLMEKPDKFLEMLNGFKLFIDEEKVPAQNVDAIRPQLDDKENFTPDKLGKVSAAARGVCDWVINIALYYDVVVSVEPKKVAVREAEVQLAEAMATKNHFESLVAELKAKLQVLQDELDKVIKEKEDAEATAASCEKKLGYATRLVNALGAEGERWQNSIVVTQQLLQVVLGDVLMASAFVSYIGPFNIKYRTLIMKDKFAKFFRDNKIPASENINPLAILTTDAEMAEWQNEKLPSDEVSLQNGAILTNSDRYSLMIDPQLQGITWIKQRFADKQLQVTRLTNKRMINILETSIETGKPCLIENLENTIDAVIQPVYARAIIKKGKSSYIKMGDKELSLDPAFKLIFQTKLSNPHYPPEIQAECTLINFTVTEKGLEDQLLTLIVKKERPDLAAEKERLIQQQNSFKITLRDLEADLLFRLVNQQGDILEDIELIENLERSKALSLDIKEKVEIAKQTSIAIDEASEQYRPAASRGALVYFMMIELTKIHSFYKFSLASFIIVINRAIDIVADMMRPQKAPAAEGAEEGKEAVEEQPPEEKELTPAELKERIMKLIEEITFQAFDYTRRGTFVRHKLIVATMLTLRINKRKGKINEEEEQALIKKDIPLDCDPQPNNLAFMQESHWLGVQFLKKLPMFKEIAHQLESEALQWKKWYGEEKAEIAELPKSQKDLTSFHKLLLLRALRPDRLTRALEDYVKESLGDRYIDADPFLMSKVYPQMSVRVPVFFVLFPGVDPTPSVEEVGRTLGKSINQGTFTNISMGQGQEKKALDALAKAGKEGNWIMVQNVHLMTDWMKDFERSLEVVIEDNCHPDFRVFISSEPPGLPDMEIIPESILQNSIKIANEAPSDLKNNLRRALSKFPTAYWEKAKSHKENEFKALIFGLCMFHSLILGRRKFGAIGWSRIYNFNDGDLTICGDVLHNYLAKYEKVPYQDLVYIYAEIMYGGHITDELDRRTNITYLQRIIQPEIMNQMQLTQTVGFKSPIPNKFDREKYVQYVEKELPAESPQMFGLHPNAEIGYNTAAGDALFEQILLIQGGSGGGAGAGVQTIIDEFLKKIDAEAPQFIMQDIKAKVTGDPDPYWTVCLQECERINILTFTIKTSLIELDMGLKGQLNITDVMDQLQRSLSLGFVPGSWAEVAYPSLKQLQPWFADMLKRYAQLKDWTDAVKTPDCLWISGLFNPMSFLTAIMQKTARAQTLPLDFIILKTDVMNFDRSEIKEKPEDGAYIDGFFLDGANWEKGRGGEQGYLCEQTLKELNPELPVMHVTAVTKDKRPKIGYYNCPMYVTKTRGPTLVYRADIKMESDESQQYKWILAGVALVMNAD